MRSLARARILPLALGALLQHASAEDPPIGMCIAGDDLRDGVAHVGGRPQTLKPNIDCLAEHGLSFAKASCSVPMCDTHCTNLQTGIAPSKSGVCGNKEMLRDNLPHAITLMQHSCASGYSARGAGEICRGSGAYDKDSWHDYFTSANSEKPRRDKR